MAKGKGKSGKKGGFPQKNTAYGDPKPGGIPLTGGGKKKK